jgi:hypothetical protein
MRISKAEQFGGSLSFLVGTGGTGVTLIFPDAKWVGWILIVAGFVPFIWLVGRHIFQWMRPQHANQSSLEIIFDPDNPGRKFWSIESALGEPGKTSNHTYWEYRALIKNTSTKAIRNVRATVEAIGPIPTRPEPSYFDINKKPNIDLAPGEETLVIIRRWFNPPKVAGMVFGGAYGPVKMTVYADDALPVEKHFRFDPEKKPMISEIPV